MLLVKVPDEVQQRRGTAGLEALKVLRLQHADREHCRAVDATATRSCRRLVGDAIRYLLKVLSDSLRTEAAQGVHGHSA